MANVTSIKHSPRFQDLTSKTFGRLTVISEASPSKGATRWKCKCECGAICEVQASNLKGGHTTSCGCFGREQRSQLTHGLSHHRAYGSWSNMIRRCTKQNRHNYKWYGGRGIAVCLGWMQFDAFWKDMGETWFEGATIDRRDGNGNYCKENCRWATQKQQMNNTSASIWIEHNGLRMTLSQWAMHIGCPRYLLMNRRRRGWSVQRMMTDYRFPGNNQTPKEQHTKYCPPIVSD